MIPLMFAYFALFASALSVNKLILGSLSLWFFVALRRLSGGLLLFGYHFFASERMRFCYLKNDFTKIFKISVLTMFLPSLLKAYSFQNLVSSKAAFLGSLDPFVTAFYAYLLWGETLSTNKIVGMLVGAAGVFVLLTTNSPAEMLHGGIWIFSWPELAMIGSLMMSRYGWILARNMLKTDRYTPSELNSLIMIISGIYALITAYLVGACDFCTIPLTFTFIALFAYSVFFGEIIGYTIYGHLLKHHNITLISLTGLSVPLFVHLYGPFILGESLSLVFFAALALFALGMYIFYCDDKKK